MKSQANRNAGQKALITGATGFVGFHLANRLMADGWKVDLLIREKSDTKKLSALPEAAAVHKHDGSTAQMIEIVQQSKPDIVFHLASYMGGEHQSEDIEALIQSNILFGTQLLEGMLRAGVRYFINTGTYWQHFNQEDYNPVNLYAATKEAFEAILRIYVECFSIRAVTLKLFDVYGPGDRRNKLFNLLEETYRTGQTLSMTPGKQKLDLVYIDDVVAAFCRAADLIRSTKSRKLKDTYAVASFDRISLKEIVQIYQHVTKRTLSIKWGGKPYRTREVMLPWKGNPLPGWKTNVNLETGIKRMLSANQEQQPPKNQRSERLETQTVLKDNHHG